MKRTLLLVILLFPIIVFSQETIIEKGNLLYLSNTVIIKTKEGFIYPTEIQEKLNKTLKKKIIREVRQNFQENTTSLYKGEQNLSRIFTLKIEEGIDPLETAKKISSMKEIEWAEPKFIRKVAYDPNDSLFNQQSSLNRIFASKAWEITKGDSNVIIGIVDTGVDWQHPDISANIYRDKNGNIVGYDFGGSNGIPDEDPSEDPAPVTSSVSYHGTHVAGIAAAVTNNKIGIASIGFNCSIMPVKVSRSDKRDPQNNEPYVYYGPEGIKYAAEHGAKVINCSWGGYGYSKYEQEIIDYAISKGALVVAAAGNDNKRDPFYPASYDGVLSVGWLYTDSDTRVYSSNTSGANYGTTVDVFAPGISILSTWPTITGEYYKAISGSSMSSPLVAGLAGLVFSRFPNYNPLQVAERIRVTCDDIYANSPDSLKYLLGRGRINAFKAVKDTNLVSIRAVNVKYIDEGNENGLLERGEVISMNVIFKNFLDNASNIFVELTTSDPSIQIVNSNFTISQLNTLDTLSNSSNRFKFIVSNDAPYNHKVEFMLKYTGNNYSDFQWITVRINPTYDTHNANKITMTITSKGTLGFNDYPDNLEGDGFKFENGENLLFEGAFMYGVSETQVMDAAREDIYQSDDFNIIQQMKITDTQNGDQIGTAIFDDSNFGPGKLGIETHLTSYSFILPPDDKYIILLTELKNKSTQNINNLYVGYFFDWDMPAEKPDSDITDYDDIDNFGYAFCVNQNLVDTYVGAALISHNNYGFYPIENSASTGDIRLFDSNGFTKKEKWISLSSGIIKTKVGPADVSFVISGGPFNLPVGESIPIAFAVAAGNDLNDLRAAISSSREKYRSLITHISNTENLPQQFELSQNYPNPFNSATIISYNLSEKSFVTLKVYDILGREIVTLVNEYKNYGSYKVEFSAEKYKLSSGVYFYTLYTGKNMAIKKMILMK